MKAAYYRGNLTTTVSVLPIPIVTIVSADWDPVTLLFKVQANTSYANSILTDGTDAALLALLPPLFRQRHCESRIKWLGLQPESAVRLG